MRRATPVRTCVGCHERAPQPELVRFVAVAGALQLDPKRRAPGRGAYLHRRPACWTAFERRRGPVRSLRSTPHRDARARLVVALAAAATPGAR